MQENTALNPWEGFWCLTLEQSKKSNAVSLIVKNKPELMVASATLPVYNQAYQENFAEDSLSEIINNARNAYVLLDPI